MKRNTKAEKLYFILSDLPLEFSSQTKANKQKIDLRSV